MSAKAKARNAGTRAPIVAKVQKPIPGAGSGGKAVQNSIGERAGAVDKIEG